MKCGGMLKNMGIATLLVAAMVYTGLVGGTMIPKILPATVVETVEQPQTYSLGQLSTQSYDDTAEAYIIIHAPNKGVVGELIRFDVSSSLAESFKWLLVPESIDFEVYDDGKRAVFSARKPGKYLFIVACAYEGTVDVMTHVVTIAGDPDNPDNPDAFPVVEKPDKSTLESLDVWMAYWCSQSKRSKSETLKLAASFESVSATIDAGVLNTPAEIAAATSEANRKALGDGIDGWKPVLVHTSQAMRERAEHGILQTPDQHAELWLDIASGLRMYADLFPEKEAGK